MRLLNYKVTTMKNANFGQALEELKAGYKCYREGWNGKGMFLFMIACGAWEFQTDVSGTDEIDTMPFICMKTADNKLVPWLASQTDMLAEDWCSDRVY